MIQELQRSRVPQAPIITVRPSPRMVRFYYLAAAGMASVLAIATILSIAFMPFELKILYCLYIAGGSLSRSPIGIARNNAGKARSSVA